MLSGSIRSRQHGIGRSTSLKVVHSLLQAFDVRDLQWLLVEPRQRLLQQSGVVGIVFHQQNMQRAGAHRHVSFEFYNDLLFGSLTRCIAGFRSYCPCLDSMVV